MSTEEFEEWVEYQWSEEEKSVVTNLGLVWWGGSSVNSQGHVWIAYDADENYYVAKVMQKGSREIKALQTILSLSSPRNKVVPGRLVECRDSYVHLMPRLITIGPGIWAQTMTWNSMLDHFYIMIDYVQFMEENNIAYLDISLDNTVWSMTPVSYGGFDVPAGELYFIDFGSARVLPSGPGSDVKIYDYNEAGGKYTTTEATDVMDPYAYDILALGYTFENAFWWYREVHTPGTPTHIPRAWTHFAVSLRAADPLQRPSIFRTRRLFLALRKWESCVAWMYKISPRFADNFEYYGWRIISPFIR